VEFGAVADVSMVADGPEDSLLVISESTQPQSSSIWRFDRFQPGR